MKSISTSLHDWLESLGSSFQAALGRWAFFGILACVCPSRADEGAARAAFEDGVQLAQEGRLEEAAQAFERSTRVLDRPRTRHNLAVIYDKLGRPLEVVSHALAFAQLPQAGDTTTKERVAGLLAKALTQVAVLNTAALPTSAKIRVDAAEPAVRKGARVYILPGAHTLEICTAEHVCETLTLLLAAGHEQPWPFEASKRVSSERLAQGPRIEKARNDTEAEAPRRRPAAARSMGILGGVLGLSAFAVYALSVRRAERLREHDPFADGLGENASKYWRARNAVMPLAFAGGALMAGAVAIQDRPPAKRSWALISTIVGGSLLAGGIYLLSRPPSVLGSLNTERPTRQAGSLVFSISLPLLVHAIRGLNPASALTRSREVQAAIRAN